MGIAADLIYIMLAALLGGIVAKLLRQPLILGYILAGVMVGPHTSGPTIVAIDDVEKLAEIGIGLLLFALGLEFSLKELRRYARIVFIATPLQIVLSGIGGFFLARFLNLSQAESIWFGSVISLSSTMVVLKSLFSRDSMDTQHGRVMLGMLIAQDLAVIPMMLILPQISGEQVEYASISVALFKSIFFLGAVYIIGTKVFPRLFAAIAAWGSRELFLLCTLAVALGVGLASHALGLSFAFGAFIAGMLLSETDFSYQALSDISSLRDIFGLLFFVSVGMLLDPNYFITHLGTVFFVVVSIIILKSISVGLAVSLLGYRGATPWIAGFGLSQIGEFAFLIAQSGVQIKIFSAETQSLIIAVAVISMFCTPFLLSIGPRVHEIALKACSVFGWKNSASVPQPSPVSKRNHVVIVGAGVVGSQIARVLTMLGIDCVAVEADFRTAANLREKKIDIIFGDASHQLILEAANIKEARLVILTVTNIHLTVRILQEIRRLNSSIPVVARVQEIEDTNKLESYGVGNVIEPQREATLEMLRQGLLSLGIGEGKIFHVLSQVRTQFYDMQNEPNAIIATPLKNFVSSKLLDMTLQEVRQNSPIAGSNLAELKLRERFSLSVVGIVRGDEFIPNPQPDLIFRPDDLLALVGASSALAEFRKYCS